MDRDSRELFDLLVKIAEQKELVSNVLSGASDLLIGGAASLIGGLFFGRGGAVLGGLLSTGITAVCSPKNKFKLVVTVLKEMRDKQQMCLCDSVVKACKKFGVSTAAELIPLLKTRKDVKNVAMNEVLLFINKMKQP